MTLYIRNVKVPVTAGEDSLRSRVAERLGVRDQEILGLHIRKKSLDARRKRDIHYLYQVHVDLHDEKKVLAKGDVELAPEVKVADPLADVDPSHKLRHPPVIIGSGPAGIFAALVLAEAGHRPIIVERGEPVEKRFRTVNRLLRKSDFNEESNYCYGEGGAGTFSDGKLTCGRNHPYVRYLFSTWVKFGAPPEILYDAHPHIGTDNLMTIATRMRQHLEALGATFLFGRRFIDFEPQDTRRLDVILDGGERLPTDHLVLALGHSARETYRVLKARGLAMSPKPFAIGARIEHPQEEIDRIQFGSCTILPAAEYKLTAQAGDRGIWTFCMCPGGHLMPTGAQAGHLAINGMSYHARNSGFANAAVVVNVRREDYFQGEVLDGVKFQADIEQRAFAMGGENYFSPAQRLTDFLKGRPSQGELKSSYKPGVVASRLDRLLPEFVVESLQGALYDYNKRMRGYISDNAIVAGVETKTSSPVMMMRDKSLMSVSHPGVFPTGEGAGFAGGIVSAALDGTRVARSILMGH